jgi:hypothetical protein
MTYNTIPNPRRKRLNPPSNPCIESTAPIVAHKAPKEAKKGHGLGSTK